MSNILKQEDLKKILSYNPETGIFIWLLSTSPNQKIGNIAGCIREKKYRIIQLNGLKYYSHRLAWFYMTGNWPKEELDHINGIKDDDRFVNLREVSRLENNWNSCKPKTNTTGIKGITNYKERYWYAKVTCKRINYEKTFPFTEEGKEQAIRWLKNTRESLHGDYTRHN